MVHSSSTTSERVEVQDQQHVGQGPGVPTPPHPPAAAATHNTSINQQPDKHDGRGTPGVVAVGSAAPVSADAATTNTSTTGTKPTTTTNTTTTPAAAAVIRAVPEDEDDADSYEQTHVHAVYESIAPHFSATRYKPWPVIASFLGSLSPGAVGLDVGCGNGKYLGVNRDVHVVGCDRSASLVRIARDHGGRVRGQDVAVADGLALPFPRARADFAICVAVIHHMSTRRRRQDAVRELLECVRSKDDGGKVLVYVWALEQSGSRRGWDQGAAQDQLVPWIFKSQAKKKKLPPSQEKTERKKEADTEGDQQHEDKEASNEDEQDSNAADATYHRFYHLYREGELEEDVVAAGGAVLDSGYDKDNWWAIAGRVNR